MNRNLIPIAFLLLTTTVFTQQNHLLYFADHVAQANYQNPAYQSPCKTWIGIPVLSSVHLNYGNSTASFRDLFTLESDGTYSSNYEQQINKLKRRNFVGFEFQTTLLGAGYHWKNWYFNFNIIEKVEADFFLSRNMIDLFWRGNAPGIGETITIKNTGPLFNYYREYAFGASKNVSSDLQVGGKAKLLFGKLNLTTKNTSASLATSDEEFYLDAGYNIKVNSSMPFLIETDENGMVSNVELSSDIDIKNLLLNRKNWGLAFDAGLVYNYSEKIMLSASVLDLGFIRWRSNLNTISGTGDLQFRGISTPDEYDFISVDNLLDTFNFQLGQDKYIYFLPLKLNVGAQYHMNHFLNVNVLYSSKLYRSKCLNTFGLMVDVKPTNWFYLSTGYTLQYGSYNNWGLGFTLGLGPVQFYAISDNIAGFFWPLNTRNVNLRFGFNLNFGCRNKDDESTPGFMGSQVPCPKIDIRKNKHKQQHEKKRKRKK